MARPLHATVMAAALCAGLIALAPAPAAAQEGAPIVVAGLRPTTDATFKTTQIKSLPEAQELRVVLDQAVNEVSQRPVVNHAALRARLGASYLVDLFDCQGETKCVSRTLAKVRSTSALAVYGDYAVSRGKYLFRLRLIELTAAKVLSEEIYSVGEEERTSSEQWTTHVKALFLAVGLTGSAGGTGGGEEGGGEEGGGEEGGGEEGGGEEGGGEEEGGEELSEEDLFAAAGARAADSQQNAPETAAEAVPRENHSIDLSAGGTVTARRFRLTSAPGESPAMPTLQGDWSPGLNVAVTLHPFAWRKKDDLLDGLRLQGTYARTGSDADPARDLESRLYLGLLYRIPVGTLLSEPIFRVSAGFSMDEVRGPAVPQVSYRAAAFGAGVRFPISTPRFSFNADLRYLVTSVGGSLVSSDHYGDARAAGFDAIGFFELRLRERLTLHAGGTYDVFVLDFGDGGALSGPGAVGATDRTVGVRVGVGLIL